MIDGVIFEKLKKITDERGWLMEIMRCDSKFFQKFGQAYATAANPNVVKAWHMHRKQTDNLACIKGTAKIVLFDDRDNSPTKGEINEFDVGENIPAIVKIPPEVWHGFKALDEIAIVINVPTELYDYTNPDENRLPPDTEKIPYDWKLDPRLKHG